MFVYAFLDLNTAQSKARQASYNGRQGHLLTIASSKELDFVKETFVFESAWVAASDVVNEGSWKWTAGTLESQTVDESLFAENEPNGDTSINCAMLTGEGLKDRPCTNVASYIVKFPGMNGSCLFVCCSFSGFFFIIHLIDSLP